MFCSVITETVRTTCDQVIQIVQEVFLESRVFGIYVRKSVHLSCCTMITVTPLSDFVKSVVMIQLIPAACCIDQVLRYFTLIRCCMVRDNVYDNIDSIFVCFRTHFFEIISGSQLIVTDLPVGRLIMPPPDTVSTTCGIGTHDFHICVSILTFVCR